MIERTLFDLFIVFSLYIRNVNSYLIQREDFNTILEREVPSRVEVVQIAFAL